MITATQRGSGGAADDDANIFRSLSQQLAREIKHQFDGRPENPGTIFDLRQVLERCGFRLEVHNVDATWDYLDKTVWLQLRDQDRFIVGQTTHTCCFRFVFEHIANNPPPFDNIDFKIVFISVTPTRRYETNEVNVKLAMADVVLLQRQP